MRLWEVARCSFLLPCNLIKTCMCMCVCVTVKCWVSVCTLRTRLVNLYVCVCLCDSEMLGQCVYTAYKARRCLLHTDTQCRHDIDVRHGTCLRLCNRASRLLSETIAQLDIAPNNLHITKVCHCSGGSSSGGGACGSCCSSSSSRSSSTLCSKKSDAKIQITLTMAYLIRIKYPLSGFNYHLSDVNVANFNKIHRKVSEQQLF